MMKEKPNMGVWSPSCVRHGFINASILNRLISQIIRDVAEQPKHTTLRVNNNFKNKYNNYFCILFLLKK